MLTPLSPNKSLQDSGARSEKYTDFSPELQTRHVSTVSTAGSVP